MRNLNKELCLIGNNMNLKEFLLKVAKSSINFRRKRTVYMRWYQEIEKQHPSLRLFSFIDAEKDWIKKWKKYDKRLSTKSFRIFSHFIGPDLNIIPLEVCASVVEPILMPYQFREYYNDKNMLPNFLPSNILPQAILRNINGFFYSKDLNPIDANEARNCLLQMSSTCTEVVAKGTLTMGGVGVQIFRKTGGGYFVNKNNEKLSLDYLLQHYVENFLVEEKLRQCDEMTSFGKTSVNTIRMVTYKSVNTGEIVCLNAVLRMGRNGSETDNACQGGSYVGINIDDGSLGKYAINDAAIVQNIFNDIDFAIKSYKIPVWEEVKSLARLVHSRIHHHNLVAMDIAITDDGLPKLIEVNIGAFTANLFQLTVKPTFGEYTDEIMDYCFERYKQYYPTVTY